ncbi:sugar-binding transcriptional regulator [Agrobacterium vaccinii]|uniref:sugar-binding transcriptional regulator n=1 Tax=Agrobacterium vaccinii TaxID=2735528 RepID=UPI001E528E96|nr:sugar-binding transcriptional regulator [Agrobacterium vaccinii]UHS63187.1 sugar-binding transcriptional regulator [Agrobacterium vaccinii]
MPYQQSMVRASWLYHVEGLTQAQIAERMLLTRRRVNELLAAALDQGVVRISFNSPLTENVELEAELRQRFGLKDVVIVPTPADKGQISAVIGRAAAMFLDRLIQASEPASLGVGWGATLRETVHHMVPTNAPDVKVRSMMGGLTRGSEINTFEIVRSFAKVMNAECHYLAAPIYADSPDSRDAILVQPFFDSLLAEATAVDVSILSVGDVSPESLQVRYGLPTGTDVSELIAAGAVGDLLGRYLNHAGHEVDHPLNRQVISPSISQYQKIPTRIIASGGDHKKEILKSCLIARLATTLITDAENALYLLER